MAIGLITVKESPRWLADKGRVEEALDNLAYLRKLPRDDERVCHEMAEIEAAIREEKEARVGLGLKEVFFGKGNTIRFVIAIVIFILQQWSGQNSVGYYAPQIFQSVSTFYISIYPFIIKIPTKKLDRIHRRLRLPARLRNLRNRQSRRHRHLRLLPRRNPRSEKIPLHLRHGHGHPLLHRRRHPQNPSSPERPSSEPSCCIESDGGDALYLCVFLFDGVGAASVGVLFGYL